MPFLTSILNWLNINRIHQINLFKSNPFDIQKDMLFRLIDKAERTEWGLKYDYASIHDIRDFQQRVPLHSYEDIKSQIERLRLGEKNVLWPGEIKWFAKSSGTTNEKSKFIPVSKESLEDCHFRGGRDVLLLYMQNFPETRIFNGKGLTLGGSHKIDNHNNQSYTGDLSAILIDNLPFWTDFIKTPSSEIALLEKWEEKLEKIAQNSITENVTHLMGVPSWNLVMIKYILEYSGKKELHEIWPNLELFIHGGVSFTPYKKQFKQLIPHGDMRYMETYNASEGFIAIQDDLEKNDMLLMLDYGIFYEFIPFDQINDKDPQVLTINDVKTNVNYAVVITTNSGLWRYILGDTVQFTSLMPPKIIITGRTKHFINAFGEELIIDNAERALKKACEQTDAQIIDYTACPIYMSKNQKGAHEWLIEFEKTPTDFNEFINVLDNSLMELNSDYEAKRYKDITLDSPVVRAVNKNTFYTWLKNKNKLGGQNKIPRLANNRIYVEELLKIHLEMN